MAEDLTKKLEQLGKAHESGLLDTETYQATVAALELQRAAHAQLQGSGSVAQGSGAVSASAGGMAAGHDLTINKYVGPPPTDTEDALKIYCRIFRAQSQQFLLRGLDKKSSDSTAQGSDQLRLDQVYVNLNTTTNHERDKANEEEAKPVTAIEAAGTQYHVVLLGDPGSGKSTFVSYLGFCLASLRVDPDRSWEDTLSVWKADDLHSLIPILVTVREFAQWLKPEMLEGRPAEQHLWDFFCTRLRQKNLECVSEILRERLDSGKVYVLFDGLDEIATSEQRRWVSEAIAAFMHRYPTTRMLVTCRVLSYQDPEVQLHGVQSFQLAPFNQQQIDTFVASWYAELHRAGQVPSQENTLVLTDRLKEAVRRPDLQRFAPNPLLLTVMALVHTHKGRLPGARALLYEETVEILLWRWEQMKTPYHEQDVELLHLLQQADRTEMDLKRVLWELAFRAHERGSTREDRLADIGELDLIQAMAALGPNRSLDWGKAVVETIRLRAGLLVEYVPGRFSFPHRTFQEYLAGAYIAAQADFGPQAAQLVDEGSLWREVILLAVGRLVNVNGETDKPLALVAELCPLELPKGFLQKWHRQWLAGDVLKEIKIHRVQDRALGRELLERVQSRLVSALEESPLSPRERSEVGNTLADIGDARFLGNAWGLLDDPLLGFVEIPAGSFQMGETGKTTIITIPYDYYIAKYPVTQAQFRVFVDDAGYQDARWWPEAKAAGLWIDGTIQAREAPASYGGHFEVLNHPVVGVTWYEALAYCRWFTEQLRASEVTPEPLGTLLRTGGNTRKPWTMSLPNEPEWEKAARGVHDGRAYPWGDEPDTNLANYAETQIYATNAVGCFPEGKSPYGVEEMSGNVLEWTRSVDEDKPYSKSVDEWVSREDLSSDKDKSRILRGGSWNLTVGNMQCANRDGSGPLVRLDNFGFRVVASPFSEP